MKKRYLPKFLWDSKNYKTGIEFPYTATIEEEAFAVDCEEYIHDKLSWLICPEDVVMYHKKGNKIYKLVELTDEELYQITKATEELVKVKDF